uniref:Uncharacterized protein n=1 Tax=Eutreptiella gymnastica TaxID=73025 RepID=A0A7S4G315_9EUGL
MRSVYTPAHTTTPNTLPDCDVLLRCGNVHANSHKIDTPYHGRNYLQGSCTSLQPKAGCTLKTVTVHSFCASRALLVLPRTQAQLIPQLTDRDFLCTQHLDNRSSGEKQRDRRRDFGEKPTPSF